MNPEAHRLRVAFSLFETGCALMLQNLRRRYPGETEEQIQRRLGEWLRSGSVHPGRPYMLHHSP